jgi:hypothetical protein
MQFGVRRPVGCVCRSVVFRRFAWTCVLDRHATNLVQDGAQGCRWVKETVATAMLPLREVGIAHPE